MARTHVRRRSREHRRHRSASDAPQVLLLVGSFIVGMVLEYLRSLPALLDRSWRWDTFAILAAAWLGIVLVARTPQGEGNRLPFGAALILLVLFAGSLLMHELINPH